MHYKCEKSGHFRNTCPSLTKNHNKKDKEFYKTKRKSCKARIAYIVWEEEDESYSSNSCSSSDDECASLCLIARKKGETSRLYTYESIMNILIVNCRKRSVICMWIP